MVYSAKSDDTNTISQFTRRKDIKITTSGTSTPANYQVKLTIAYESEMQADFDDIRFNTKAGGYIDYWIESKTDSVTATVWVKLPDAITDPGSDTIWMFYGNSVLGDGGDINDMSDGLGDDFPGSSLDTGSKWTIYVGSDYSVSGGELIINGRIGIHSQQTWTYGILEMDCNVEDILQVGASYKLFGFSLNDNSRRVTHYIDDANNKFQAIDAVGNTIVDTNFVTGDSIHKIEWSAALINWYKDNVLMTNSGITTNVHNGALPIHLESYGGVGNDMTVDWIFVRKFIDNEPTPSYGTSQHQRRTPQFIN